MSSLVTLDTATTIAASRSSASFDSGGLVRRALFQLDVTLADTDAGDTLDVYIQHSPDGGTTWFDFVHFAQFLGTSAAAKRMAEWHGDQKHSADEYAPATETLGAGVVKHGPIASLWRVRSVVVDADADASFSFTVKALLRSV